MIQPCAKVALRTRPAVGARSTAGWSSNSFRSSNTPLLAAVEFPHAHARHRPRWVKRPRVGSCGALTRIGLFTATESLNQPEHGQQRKGQSCNERPEPGKTPQAL